MSAASDIALRTKRFRYDGQMPVETANFSGTSSLTWTSTARNVLGARGIDALSTETSGGTVSTYPLYDTHGNVKAYVKKEPSNTWSSLGWKQYNVWGGVRSTSGGAGTTSAYCGNLGHVSDGETGLIYMRARYYAPWAGRFVSEDPARHSHNWYQYASNAPTVNIDESGKQDSGTPSWHVTMSSLIGMGSMVFMLAAFSVVVLSKNPAYVTKAIKLAMFALAIATFNYSSTNPSQSYGGNLGNLASGSLLECWLVREYNIVKTIFQAAEIGKHTHAAAAVFASLAYSMFLLIMIVQMDGE